MSMHVSIMSDRRAKSLYKRMTRSPHGRVVVGQSANFARLDESASYPSTSRSLVGDAAHANAEAALFGKYPLFGLPSSVRNDWRFRKVLLDLPEDRAKINSIINGPAPGEHKTLPKRTVSSGAWLRSELPTGQVLYRLDNPSSDFFPRLLAAIDAVPNGKATVAGTALAQFFTNFYGLLWEKATGQNVNEIGGQAAEAVASGATGGKGVRTQDVVDTVASTGKTVGDAAMGIGMVTGGIVLSTLLPPSQEIPTAPIDPPPDEEKPSIAPVAIIGLIAAKLLGVF
jgi:hypothetical protein